eukprot:jgi/Botrbrau1/961/Bobra.114_1s0005.1
MRTLFPGRACPISRYSLICHLNQKCLRRPRYLRSNRPFPTQALGENEPEGSKQTYGPLPGEAGSPLEGPPDLQIPSSVIERLRSTVFGFDTFFVTSVENYQADGVLFKGNLRGDPAVAYRRASERLKDELGEAYRLYFLEDKEGAPVAVILPKAEADLQLASIGQQTAVAAAFGLATVVTTLAANGAPLLSPEAWSAEELPQQLLNALPGSIPFLLLLGAHEVGHGVVARRRGVDLTPGFLIPAGLGFLGSFGAITRIKQTLPNRESLLEIAAYGPLAGGAASLAAVVVGMGLSAAGIGGIDFQVVAFHDSFIVGLLGQLFLGSKLAVGGSIELNPLLTAGWAGLIVNALNSIPVGTTDGGHVAHGLWGRRAGQALNVLSLLVLGVGGIFNTLALYWLVLVLLLQRGPVIPQEEELSAPASNLVPLGLATLAIPFLVLLPYPFLTDPFADVL